MSTTRQNTYADIGEGVLIFAATPSDDAALTAAKSFISENCLTNEDVPLGHIGNTVVVKTKKAIKLLK